jgi:phage baseplate assembly protein W
MPIVWTMPATPAVSPPLLRSAARLLGRDVRFDSDYDVGANGDYITVEEVAAAKQSVVNEARTSPGELAAVPDYGMGLAAAVRKAASKAVRDETGNRVRERLRRNQRLSQVVDVAVTTDEDGLLRVDVTANVAGKEQRVSIVQEPRP